MKLLQRILLIIVLFSACTPEDMPSGVKPEEPNAGPITIKGRVVDDSGKSLSGVVVSDGLNCVKTNEKGEFALSSELDKTKFVHISIPSGYQVQQKNGLPIFYKRLSEEKKFSGLYDLTFTLNKQTGNYDKYTILIAADPQPRSYDKGFDKIGYHSLDCCDDLYRDMQETGAEIRKVGMNCYGIMLGDIVHEDMALFDKYITKGTIKMGFPVFNVLGNHDNDYTASSDAEGARVFEQKFGPVNYSFNLGDIHYIVVDNLIMTTAGGKLDGNYNQGLRDDIWTWLKNDLSHVSRDTPIMLCSHAPMFMTSSGTDRSQSNNTSNGKRYADLLSKYSKVYAWAGHTHETFNHIYTSGTLKNIEVHTIVRSTGELWTNEYQSGGTPRGYVIVEVDGKDVSWKFKPTQYQTGPSVGTTPAYAYRGWEYNGVGVATVKETGEKLDEDYQMNVYPRGIYEPNYVYANIFMWDSFWDKPVYTSSDGVKSTMTKVSAKANMFDYGHKEIYEWYKTNNSSLKASNAYLWNPGNLNSLFRVYTSKVSDRGTVTVKDRFGNIYTSKVSW